jgi:hypothetical protein
MLTNVIDHASEEVSRVNDPKAQALLETTEVLIGLRKAYEDFEKGTEEAWKKAS